MKPTKDPFAASMYRRLVAPALLTSLGMAFSDMADAIVVGRRMGATGLAAIGMTLPLFMVINLLMHGFGIGGSVRFAQLMAEGKAEQARLNQRRITQLALGVSVALAGLANLFPHEMMRLLGCAQADAALYRQTLDYARITAGGAPLFFFSYITAYYLRADGHERLAGAAQLAGTAADILLNVLLVLALDMGAAGAALSTLAGCLLTGLICLPALRGRALWRYASGLSEGWECFRAGLATSVQYAYQMAFLLLANRALMRIGGETSVAVFDMVQNASYLLIYLYDAAAKALQPLAGTFHGEKNRAATHAVLRLALRYGLLCGGAAALLIACFPQAVCALFGLSGAQALATGGYALRVYCISSLFAGAGILLESYYQAVGEERSTFVIATFRGCAVLLPVTLLLAVVLPEDIWWTFPITEGLSLALFWLWRRFAAPMGSVLAQERVLPATIRSRTDDLSGLMARIDDFCDRWGASPRQRYFVTMTAEEISLAIIEKAFDRMTDGYIQITLIALENGDFELHIRDNATFFNPFSMETAAVTEADFDMDAMGMLVVKKRAKSFYYRQYQGFNTLVVIL